MSTWRNYLKNKPQIMRPYVEGELLPVGCSVANDDIRNGSPKVGDMIAQGKPGDIWLVNEKFFKENYILAQ